MKSDDFCFDMMENFVIKKKQFKLNSGREIFMPSKERAITGEKNKKTTEDPIPGKEKAKDRRESSLPEQPKPGKTNSNQDEPKAENQGRGKNDN